MMMVTKWWRSSVSSLNWRMEHSDGRTIDVSRQVLDGSLAFRIALGSSMFGDKCQDSVVCRLYYPLISLPFPAPFRGVCFAVTEPDRVALLEHVIVDHLCYA